MSETETSGRRRRRRRRGARTTSGKSKNPTQRCGEQNGFKKGLQQCETPAGLLGLKVDGFSWCSVLFVYASKRTRLSGHQTRCNNHKRVEHRPSEICSRCSHSACPSFEVVCPKPVQQIHREGASVPLRLISSKPTPLGW